MVSSGTVANDTYSLHCYLENYLSEINNIDNSWTGSSHDSIISQAENFVSEYDQIVTQMNNFANACNEYENYIRMKLEIKLNENKRAAAEDKYKSSYDNPLFEMRNLLDKYKNNIQKYLTEASNLKLDATAVSIPVLSSNDSSKSSSKSSEKEINSTKSSDLSNAEVNKKFVESLKSQVGNTIEDYPGLGFHDDEWCADFVSYSLRNAGYDVEWSSSAGHVDDGSIFKNLEKAGATIHLDKAAQYNGEKPDDYNPQPGDIVLFDWADGGTPDGITNHVGIVIKDNGDGTITTIEGNTYGEAGGSCVAIHTDKSREEVYGYATPVKKKK